MNRQRIENTYHKFFRKFKIDSTTGVLQENPNLKFATMPYIGRQYFLAKQRILFIAMDIGKDETKNKYQSLDERNQAIEKDIIVSSPHISGTYCAALYLLKELHGWQDTWQVFCANATYSQATKIKHHEDGENPLAFVALTNLHKFVTIDREKREGDLDRKFLKKEFEEAFLLEEIKLLKPHILFLQGQLQISPETMLKIKGNDIKIIAAPHPAYRKAGGRNPLVYVGSFGGV